MRYVTLELVPGRMFWFAEGIVLNTSTPRSREIPERELSQSLKNLISAGVRSNSIKLSFREVPDQPVAPVVLPTPVQVVAFQNVEEIGVDVEVTLAEPEVSEEVTLPSPSLKAKEFLSVSLSKIKARLEKEFLTLNLTDRLVLLGTLRDEELRTKKRNNVISYLDEQLQECKAKYGANLSFYDSEITDELTDVKLTVKSGQKQKLPSIYDVIEE